MTNQEAIYQQKYLKEMHNASPEVMESCNMAIKALSVDYEGMVEEIEERKANVKGTYETWQEDKALYTGYEVALSIIRKYAKIGEQEE